MANNRWKFKGILPSAAIVDMACSSCEAYIARLHRSGVDESPVRTYHAAFNRGFRAAMDHFGIKDETLIPKHTE